MPIVLSESSTYTTTVSCPTTGDARTPSSVNTAFQALANRTKWLKAQVTALQAVSHTQDTDVGTTSTTYRLGPTDTKMRSNLVTAKLVTTAASTWTTLFEETLSTDYSTATIAGIVGGRDVTNHHVGGFRFGATAKRVSGAGSVTIIGPVVTVSTYASESGMGCRTIANTSTGGIRIQIKAATAASTHWVLNGNSIKLTPS